MPARSSRSRFDALDAVLFGLAVMGAVLFLVVLPGQHPDGAASYALGNEGAQERAAAFLQEEGYATEDLTAVARLTREADLLDSLQHDLGRPAAIRALRAGLRERLPAHYWQVQFRQAGLPDEAGTAVYTVGLTQEGRPWTFRNHRGMLPRSGVDRAVLRELLQTDAAEPLAISDSTLRLLLYFDLEAPVEAEALPPVEADRERVRRAAVTGQAQGLSGAAAVAIAQAHLAETALAALPLVPEQVAPLPERGRAAARVTFRTAEPVAGQHAEVAADVSAAGALLALSPAFNAAAATDGVAVGFVIEGGADTLRDGLKWFGYVVLVVVLLVVVFRRLFARALDARAALKDALLAALLAAVGTVLSLPLFLVEFGGWGWQVVLFIGLGALFGGAGIGLTVFVASAASDALARQATPTAIETLTLARMSYWVNEPVGRALLRGVALAFVLVGAATAALWAFPGAVLDQPNAQTPLHGEIVLSLLGAQLMQSGWYGLLLVLAAFVGGGALLARWRRGALVPGLALVLLILQVEAVQLPDAPAAAAWGVMAFFALGLAFAYRRYDALTVLVGLVLAGTLWGTAEGFVVEAAPTWIDAVLAFGVAAAVAVVGFVGVRSGRSGAMLPRYEPDYVVEQRERGRLQREIEIAREVQQSFLPARTPEVEGLDIAARCVPAAEVGGDYYDIIPLGPDRLALVVGDVSGKGIQAAFFMTLTKGFLQTLAREVSHPAEVLRRLNRLFVANAPRGTFVSLVYGVFDRVTGTFTFARAGHTPVLLQRGRRASADVVQPRGIAIGLTPGAVFDEAIQEQTLHLDPGDTLVLYTDGLSEAMNHARILYSDERLAATVARSAGSGAGEVLETVLADVRTHTEEADQHDDMTVVVVRVAPPARGDGQAEPAAASALASPA